MTPEQLAQVEPGGALFVLAGHPVAHSISPALHGAAYEALGLSGYRYEAVDCPDEAALRRVVDALRTGGLRGANVTVPWKRLAAALAARSEGLASEAGAANVLAVEQSAGGPRVVAHNTDIGGLAAELRLHARSQRAATILGSGGAAVAALLACRAVGAERIWVSSRGWSAARPAAAWERASALERLGATPVAWPDSALSAGAGPLADAIAQSDVLLQATTAGMSGAADGRPLVALVPWQRVQRGLLVYDLVYNPARTPLLEAAEAAGLRAVGGLGMLVEQAALALEVWLGRPAPRDAMRAAALRALRGVGAAG